MTANRKAQLSVLGSSVLISLLVSACGAARPVAAGPAAVVSPAVVSPVAAVPSASSPSAPGIAGARTLVVRDTFADCERRLAEHSRGGPTMAIVGASYTAGVGPGVASRSWAAVLGRTLRWNAVIYGVPGAGYVARGTSDLGPVSRMVAAERLPALHPALVIVQAGHDDGDVPLMTERRQVTKAIAEIRIQAPQAKIALITVFTKPDPTHDQVYYRTDRAIVTAARAADPAAIIMDPLAGRWKFAHFHGVGLHPTAAGDAAIARRVAAILQTHGVVAGPARTTAPQSCQISIGVGDGTGGRTSTDRDD